jgi:hypothetical protein
MHASVSGDAAAATAPNRSATQLGRSLVGLRVSVWWEEDEAWYDGTVRDFDQVQGEHLVLYDDGDQVCEALDDCRCDCARVASVASIDLLLLDPTSTYRLPLCWLQMEAVAWWHEDSRTGVTEARRPTCSCIVKGTGLGSRSQQAPCSIKACSWRCLQLWWCVRVRSLRQAHRQGRPIRHACPCLLQEAGQWRRLRDWS